MNDFVGKTACLICGGIAGIIINKHLRPIPKEIENKVDPRNPFCNDCLKMMETCTMLISVREPKDDEERKNPYRTGNQCWAKHEYALKLFPGEKAPPIGYIPDDVWVEIGLPTGNEDHTDPNKCEGGPIAVCLKCGNERYMAAGWRESKDETVIKARCLKCDPNQTDTEHELFEHRLEKYKFHATSESNKDAPSGGRAKK